ncbi:type VII toxin-antitoxin system HepT family RNase toxin [Lutispora thermophila]|uniref:Uncharacterized conserved protein YutE, UPF0331/DUF86 family n=1 Tax=Lutispora thermophila DSM 19022 TaxID=1122184 RepID=A0A1M6DSL3_9FIRM|nr:DUF86 domain-containing protein [Lutispora thermophila]SHI76234.1 Uncharacterized conserved protein YutE, UPF0331/DUF86 family [Lutispora thermophila DSM 19022]
MTKDVYDVIIKKMKDLEGNLVFLKKASFDISKDNIKKDMIRYWGIERGIQICIECVIDIANIIISTTENVKPNTYKETIVSMAEIGVIPKSFSDKLTKMIGFRNILVHDYVKVDENMILRILKYELDDFIDYMNYVRKWIEENYHYKDE